jgi:hypothetical protein
VSQAQFESSSGAKPGWFHRHPYHPASTGPFASPVPSASRQFETSFLAPNPGRCDYSPFHFASPPGVGPFASPAPIASQHHPCHPAATPGSHHHLYRPENTAAPVPSVAVAVPDNFSGADDTAVPVPSVAAAVPPSAPVPDDTAAPVS